MTAEDWQRLLAVAAGGAVGAVLRYLAAVGMLRWTELGFPLATLLVNAVGCFALGVMLHGGAAAAARWPALAHPGVTVGVLGALTTFSTFGYETVRLAETGQGAAAGLNIVANVLLGVGAAWVGLLLGRWLWGTP
ncbi:Putative fluoride ion transporter CrcB [Pirellulimonas nuda]|uniref:Fluoride-specific ion channel FluC n=1 Tax=Pirellulimonas nuda TaxID=2528009 RepID=A0A518DJI8_9BACT|nr:CrcB family protein [Pirellulimonas nuda]QDU91644.1 Putative fluoride ion transporter CrcB [Pirellulimonas nuda]